MCGCLGSSEKSYDVRMFKLLQDVDLEVEVLHELLIELGLIDRLNCHKRRGSLISCQKGAHGRYFCINDVRGEEGKQKHEESETDNVADEAGKKQRSVSHTRLWPLKTVAKLPLPIS